MATGSLIIVGTGLKPLGQMTLEARFWIERAERVFYLVLDPLTTRAILRLSPTAESLHVLYQEGKPRADTYDEMVERILEATRAGQRVCAVFYGHPGVFVYPSHEAIRRARLEGLSASMLPGISAEDCLFSDLGIDPGSTGCQSYEATDFLVRSRRIDTSSLLILWQIGCVGDPGYRRDGFDLRNLPVLIERLVALYGPEHEVIVYEAACVPGFEPVMTRTPLSRLMEAGVTVVSTLVVPPLGPAEIDASMLARLGLRSDQVRGG